MKMIEVKSLFKHDGQVFHPGERRLVQDADATYFAQHGWATTDGAAVIEVAPADVQLDVPTARHTAKGKV